MDTPDNEPEEREQSVLKTNTILVSKSVAFRRVNFICSMKKATATSHNEIVEVRAATDNSKKNNDDQSTGAGILPKILGNVTNTSSGP